jgi:hypothetical protein
VFALTSQGHPYARFRRTLAFPTFPETYFSAIRLTYQSVLLGNRRGVPARCVPPSPGELLSIETSFCGATRGPNVDWTIGSIMRSGDDRREKRPCKWGSSRVFVGRCRCARLGLSGRRSRLRAPSLPLKNPPLVGGLAAAMLGRFVDESSLASVLVSQDMGFAREAS